MGLFSSKPKNRRRRAKAKPAKHVLDAPEWKAVSKKKSKKGGDLVDQVYQLNAQIGVLENFIAKKSAEQLMRERMKHEGVIPPPDRQVTRRSRKKPVLSHAERRRYLAERSKSGLHFLMLFCLAGALFWWLFFSGV